MNASFQVGLGVCFTNWLFQIDILVLEQHHTYQHHTLPKLYYCRTGYFRGHFIFAVERFCRIADFNFRGFLPSLYSELLKKLGFSHFAVIYFRGLDVNRENKVSAKISSSTVCKRDTGSNPAAAFVTNENIGSDEAIKFRLNKWEKWDKIPRNDSVQNRKGNCRREPISRIRNERL